jgi:outer membrane protein assembly factor BamC
VRDFWQDSGFVLTMEQKELGIMETDWAENRAKIPQDFIRESIGKVFDGLYSTGERDRFRTRLERTAEGGTEIFVSHRGMEEVFSGNRRGSAAAQDGSTAWQPRPVDPELETEFLRRLMVRLGVSQEQSRAIAAAGGAAKPSARASTQNGQPVALVDEGFDRAWRRVGLTLDRTGFTVEDRDRAQGTYFVRYVEPTMDKSEPGFFSRLFSSTPKAKAPIKYRVVLRSNADSTVVSVLNDAGAPESSANAQRIVNVLVDDLK